MIRFWERETREARISGVKGFALFTLPCLPSPDREKGSATSQGPPWFCSEWDGDGAGAAPQHRAASLTRWGQIV